MHLLSIIVEIQPHKALEFQQATSDLVREDRTPPACLFRSMARDSRGENLFCYTEAWEDTEEMSRHFESSRFRSLLGAMKVLGEIREAIIVQDGEARDLKMV